MCLPLLPLVLRVYWDISGGSTLKNKKKKKAGDTGLILKSKNIQIEPAQPPFRDTVVYPKPKVRPKRNTENPYTGGSGDFPLKRGSKGDTVKLLQEALIKKHGKSIMPRYGADGFYGAEMAAALKKLKLPASLDESTYNVLVQGQTATKNTIAQKLYAAAASGNFKSAVALLKTMKNKDDYQTINTQFRTYRIGGVRHTLVNGMLSTFSKDEQKQAIRFEFIRMGLQYHISFSNAILICFANVAALPSS